MSKEIFGFNFGDIINESYIILGFIGSIECSFSATPNHNKKIGEITATFEKTNYNFTTIKKYLHGLGFKNKQKYVMSTNDMIADIVYDEFNFIVRVVHSEYFNEFESKCKLYSIERIELFKFYIGENIEEEILLKNNKLSVKGINNLVLTNFHTNNKYLYKIESQIVSDTIEEHKYNLKMIESKLSRVLNLVGWSIHDKE